MALLVTTPLPTQLPQQGRLPLRDTADIGQLKRAGNLSEMETTMMKQFLYLSAVSALAAGMLMGTAATAHGEGEKLCRDGTTVANGGIPCPEQHLDFTQVNNAWVINNCTARMLVGYIPTPERDPNCNNLYFSRHRFYQPLKKLELTYIVDVFLNGRTAAEGNEEEIIVSPQEADRYNNNLNKKCPFSDVGWVTGDMRCPDKQLLKVCQPGDDPQTCTGGNLSGATPAEQDVQPGLHLPDSPTAAQQPHPPIRMLPPPEAAQIPLLRPAPEGLVPPALPEAGMPAPALEQPR